MRVVDMHCDTIGEIYENRLLGNKYELKENNLHVDINKLIKGDYLLQNFAMFIDIKKYNRQYHNLKVIYSDKFHDRFIIIDKKVLYHSGASYKDLGNKCFAINKIKDDEYLENILIKIGL